MSSNPTNQTGGETPPTPGQTGEMPNDSGQEDVLTWDDWYQEQDATVQGLITQHTAGLKTALESERKSANDLTRQLKELAKSAEKGSDLETKLNAMTAKLEDADAKNSAYETFAEAKVTNFKLAWMVVKEDGLIDKRGNINLETLRTDYPELFAQPKRKAPPGNVGNGAGQPPPGGMSMDDVIRSMAGRRRNS